MAAPPGLAHLLLAARQGLERVRAVTAAEPVPRAAQAVRAQTQPRPMYFLAAVAAVLAMVLARQLAVLVGCTVLAVEGVLRLPPPLVA